MIKVVVAVAGAYVWLAGTCVLLYWSNAQASWSNSVASAAVSGVLQWFAAAGNWVIALLW